MGGQSGHEGVSKCQQSENTAITVLSVIRETTRASASRVVALLPYHRLHFLVLFAGLFGSSMEQN